MHESATSEQAGDIRLVGPRLSLIPATLELIRIELDGRAGFVKCWADRMSTVPENWPPPLTDDEALLFAGKKLEDHPDSTGWWFWYMVLRRGGGAKSAAQGQGADGAIRQHGLNALDAGAEVVTNTLVGTCGYKGPPNNDGLVEVGYSVLPQFQNNGYATEACSLLIDHAFRDPRVSRIIAHTLRSLKPSIRVLEKLKFDYEGLGPPEEAPGVDDVVIRYGRGRK